MTPMTESDCDLMGPTFGEPPTSLVTLRNRVIRPVGGASITIASYVGAPPARRA